MSFGPSTTRAQIGHLVVVNAFVGAMVGVERTVVPLVAGADFAITSTTAALAFIATFGITKAIVNAFAGAISERVGRRPVLLVGWLVGIPVPLMLMGAPSWNWILAANVLLGANQALTWSMTVVMKVDLASPATFGRVIGWNEFAGYAGLAVTAGATGLIASNLGLRPAPFYLGVALAIAGLLLSLLARETHEETVGVRPAIKSSVGLLTVLARGTWSNTRLAVASTAGMATNFKDGVLWGLLPLILVDQGMSLDRVGLVVGSYPLVWAVSQLYFGPLSDRIGRGGLIVGGLAAQGVGVAMIALGGSFGWFVLAAVVVGLGTGMVYPTLLAFVSEVAEPEWRASALGVYRFWRDSGYAAGALGGGLVADALGMTASLVVTAAVAGLAAAVFLSVAAAAVDQRPLR